MSHRTSIHIHDCTACEYIGAFDTREYQYDLYICHKRSIAPTIIARYGPDELYTSTVMDDQFLDSLRTMRLPLMIAAMLIRDELDFTQ